jgi:hypothetical protein
MSLQAAVDAWTARFIKSREASLSRLMAAMGPVDERRRRLNAVLTASVAAAKRHRIAFGLGPKVKK